MPDLMDCLLANITPSNCAAKKTSKAKKPEMTLDPDDSNDDLDPTSFVLENENKARTFLTLSHTSTPKQCEIWMKKEAFKLRLLVL
ncbi:hypothetical protein VP01_1986g3 [Puccinia sorghi]|uniref:Uncharacterized protein n=1 Tax=Puccinia sorghi TaxID=27349 RepID=A0A0L6VBN9_9BASI|nr:hypothetical protein VP01_1986g3 [Puccinia sorghi]